MADRPLVLNDLLCYLLSKFSKIDTKQLKTALMNFYTSEDIIAAKDVLILHASKLPNADKLVTIRKRRESTCRASLELDDIFSQLTAIDQQTLLFTLPRFVSDDPARMPTWSIVEGDMKAIMNRFEKLENKISQLQISVNKGVAATAAIKPPAGSSSIVSADKATTAARHTTKPRPVGPPPAGQDVDHVPNFLNELNFPPLNGRWEDDFTSGDSVHDDDNDCIWEDAPRRRRKKPRRSTSQQLGELVTDVPTVPVQLSSTNQQIIAAKAKSTAANARSRNSQSDTQGHRPSRPHYAAMAAAPPSANNLRRPRQRPAPAPMLVGKKPNDTTIKAAKPYVGKSVYCIDNLMTTVSEDDVTTFVENLGVTVLSCFRAKPRRSNWQRLHGIEPERGTFRLCIPREESDRLLRADAWPAHIAVTAWRFTKRKKTELETEDDDERDDTLTPHQSSLSALGAVGGSTVRMASSVGATDIVGAVVAPQSFDASVEGTGRFDVLRSLSTHSDSAEEMNETVLDQNGR
jgi:hypothetical protein